MPWYVRFTESTPGARFFRDFRVSAGQRPKKDFQRLSPTRVRACLRACARSSTRQGLCRCLLQGPESVFNRPGYLLTCDQITARVKRRRMAIWLRTEHVRYVLPAGRLRSSTCKAHHWATADRSKARFPAVAHRCRRIFRIAVRFPGTPKSGHITIFSDISGRQIGHFAGQIRQILHFIASKTFVVIRSAQEKPSSEPLKIGLKSSFYSILASSKCYASNSEIEF